MGMRDLFRKVPIVGQKKESVVERIVMVSLVDGQVTVTPGSENVTLGKMRMALAEAHAFVDAKIRESDMGTFLRQVMPQVIAAVQATKNNGSEPAAKPQEEKPS